MTQYEELEQDMERKTKAGIKRRAMRMSGGSVRKLQTIIKNKEKRSKSRRG